MDTVSGGNQPWLINYYLEGSISLQLQPFHLAVDCWIVTVIGSVTGNEFLTFIRNSLVPSITPFDGHSPRSIVILDNASIHHVAGVVMIQNAGALAYFLPPYSPDLNAIEHTFSKVKSVLKANEADWNELDAETAVVADFNCYHSRLPRLDHTLWIYIVCAFIFVKVNDHCHLLVPLLIITSISIIKGSYRYMYMYNVIIHMWMHDVNSRMM